MTTTFGVVGAGEFDRFLAVGGLGDDFQVVTEVDEHPKGGPQQGRRRRAGREWS